MATPRTPTPAPARPAVGSGVPVPAWGHPLRVLQAELGSGFSHDELQAWLATPHPLLGSRAPQDLLPAGLERCRQAARVDHFLRCG